MRYYLNSVWLLHFSLTCNLPDIITQYIYMADASRKKHQSVCGKRDNRDWDPGAGTTVHCSSTTNYVSSVAVQPFAWRTFCRARIPQPPQPCIPQPPRIRRAIRPLPPPRARSTRRRWQPPRPRKGSCFPNPTNKISSRGSPRHSFHPRGSERASRSRAAPHPASPLLPSSRRSPTSDTRFSPPSLAFSLPSHNYPHAMPRPSLCRDPALGSRVIRGSS
jgi:hypothetical protein